MRRMMISAAAAVSLSGAPQAAALATSFSADPVPHEHDQRDRIKVGGETAGV
jgi:hypothetical protein